jgi:hypothetical protein
MPSAQGSPTSTLVEDIGRSAPAYPATRSARFNADENGTDALKSKSPKKTVQISPDEQPGKLKVIGGSASDHFNNILVNQAISSLWRAHSDSAALDVQYGAAISALRGICPADEIEGMLAAQMVATHNAAMECYRRAMLSEQTFEGRRENLNQANRLVRSYATLVEALNRNRGKGQQRVTVEHVHVHQGGQAIVGAVQGGGVSTGTEDQPHAPRTITHEPGTPVPRPDPDREAVPVARGQR